MSFAISQSSMFAFFTNLRLHVRPRVLHLYLLCSDALLSFFSAPRLLRLCLFSLLTCLHRLLCVLRLIRIISRSFASSAFTVFTTVISSLSYHISHPPPQLCAPPYSLFLFPTSSLGRICFLRLLRVRLAFTFVALAFSTYFDSSNLRLHRIFRLIRLLRQIHPFCTINLAFTTSSAFFATSSYSCDQITSRSLSPLFSVFASFAIRTHRPRFLTIFAFSASSVVSVCSTSVALFSLSAFCSFVVVIHQLSPATVLTLYCIPSSPTHSPHFRTTPFNVCSLQFTSRLLLNTLAFTTSTSFDFSHSSSCRNEWV